MLSTEIAPARGSSLRSSLFQFKSTHFLQNVSINLFSKVLSAFIVVL